MIAYLDLPSGISGDMFLGCLIDCGWPADRLKQTIESLPLDATEWAVAVKQVMKGALRATRVEVLAEEGKHNRRLVDITSMIDGSDLLPAVRQKSIAVFTRLADAEAKVHGTSREQIHFHEVGAVDSIIDIVACVNGLHELNIDSLYASALPLGHGWMETAHGKLPLPAPATLELLSAVNAPTRPAPGPGELVTPTGAALIAELATFQQPMMRISCIGLGAGHRDCAWPNIARMWLGESDGAGQIVQMETNIDDMNPQFYTPLMDKLLNNGALDVWLTPVQMKKGRPGVVLAVLTAAINESKLSAIMLRETTTLGIRVTAVQHRHEARRELRDIRTPFGNLKVKLKWVDQDLIAAVPEYEDCLVLANAAGVSIMTVYQSAVVESDKLLSDLREEK